MSWQKGKQGKGGRRKEKKRKKKKEIETEEKKTITISIVPWGDENEWKERAKGGHQEGRRQSLNEKQTKIEKMERKFEFLIYTLNLFSQFPQ